MRNVGAERAGIRSAADASNQGASYHQGIKARVIGEGCAPPAHYVIIFVAAGLHKVAQRLQHAEAGERHAAVGLIGKARHLRVANGEGDSVANGEGDSEDEAGRGTAPWSELPQILFDGGWLSK